MELLGEAPGRPSVGSGNEAPAKGTTHAANTQCFLITTLPGPEGSVMLPLGASYQTPGKRQDGAPRASSSFPEHLKASEYHGSCVLRMLELQPSSNCPTSLGGVRACLASDGNTQQKDAFAATLGYLPGAS